jgi:hypothetical protein
MGLLDIMQWKTIDKIKQLQITYEYYKDKHRYRLAQPSINDKRLNERLSTNMLDHKKIWKNLLVGNEQ